MAVHDNGQAAAAAADPSDHEEESKAAAAAAAVAAASSAAAAPGTVTTSVCVYHCMRRLPLYRHKRGSKRGHTVKDSLPHRKPKETRQKTSTAVRS